MRVPDDLVDASAVEGARAIAQALLERADAASERYRTSEDAEALHDFRVALRRLRSALSELRPWLPGRVGRRIERKLRRRARATNAARDAEVQLAWLASSRSALAPRHRPGLELVVRRLEARRAGPDAARIVARYRRTAAKLARRLAAAEGRDVAQETGFAGALATLLRRRLERLRDRLEAAGDAGDVAAVHRARIAGKRLRYLLEPLAGNRHADATAAVRRLKALQEVLGELHDAHLLAAELRSALVDAAGERARAVFAAVSGAGQGGPALREALRSSPRPGLLALARLLRARRDVLFSELERRWSGPGLEPLAAEVRAVADALEAHARGVAPRGTHPGRRSRSRTAGHRRTIPAGPDAGGSRGRTR